MTQEDRIKVPREIRNWIMGRAQAPSVENRSEVLAEVMRVLHLGMTEADAVATACGYPPQDNLSTFRWLMGRGGGAVIELPRSVAQAVLERCDALTEENERLKAMLVALAAPSAA
jgi:hypothetical protein